MVTSDDFALAYRIRGCIYNVYKELGPGLLEEIYEEALVQELTDNGMSVETQVYFPVFYKGKRMKKSLRIDILVNRRIVVELKSVRELLPLFYKQTYGYLRITGLPLGILVNFNTIDIVETTHNITNRPQKY